MRRPLGLSFLLRNTPSIRCWLCGPASLTWGSKLRPVWERLCSHAKSSKSEIPELLERYLQAVDKAVQTFQCDDTGSDLVGAPSGPHVTEHFASVVGHMLETATSTVPHAGDGAFLVAGAVPKGGIVTCYPGIVYDTARLDIRSVDLVDEAFAPLPPAFTFGNRYLLSDRVGARTLMVDGCPMDLSAQTFASAALDARARGVPVNEDWVEWWRGDAEGLAAEENGLFDEEDVPVVTSTSRERSGLLESLASRQTALGQKLNHPPAGTEENVGYEMVAIRTSFPETLQRFIPTLNDAATCGESAPRYVVVIQALRELRTDGGVPVELFLNYGRDPRDLGYRP